ncbi:MAG: hypothetical protein A2Y12_11745 [Planctomycetes bacterium GWF2_42_9]|nr:MAG: hypothetical protein A2Y12_11745 [Planctomycetes bacterium GWF2_42_9]
MLPDSVLSEVHLTEADFLKVSQLVYDHCGINLHDGKKELVRARLAKRLRKGNFKTFSDYIDYVLRDSSGVEFSLLIDSLSTNLTSFYRENQHFDFLKSNLLPELKKKKEAKGSRKIRAWSAGCSSGEEPYTLAITLLDALEYETDWDVKVLASDISTTILDKAKTGIYEAKRVDPVPAALRHKYMKISHQYGEKYYQVGEKLKSTVIFRYVNLMADWPIGGPIDFIFCRNVMIYFDKPTQQRLVERFYNILDTGGMLFTGHSESLTGINHKFKYVRPTIYAKL